MAVSWSKILNLLPGLLAGLLPGVGGGFAKSAASRILAGSGMRGAAFDYPPLEGDFDYSVDNVKDQNKTYINGKSTVLPANNGDSIDRSTINAVLAQSLQEHNRAVKNGTEGTLLEWWPGQDTRPRREVLPKSTAVDGIRIAKDGSIQIRWKSGTGKWYTYRGGDDIRQTTEFVKDLMTAPSIGRALVRNGGRRWPNSEHLNSQGEVDETLGQADRNVGQWGRAHYEADMSKWT